jgi:nucleotide-binding universal stress UspA family protein
MFRKILIPVDNSRTDETILKHIRPLAKENGAALVLVHVADGFGARLQSQLDLADSEEVRKDAAYLEELVRQLKAEGFDVHQHLLKGDPTSGILALAKEEDADLIAMATHGHRFFFDWLFGSVAENLRHRTDIPIFMVRDQHLAPSK